MTVPFQDPSQQQPNLPPVFAPLSAALDSGDQSQSSTAPVSSPAQPQQPQAQQAPQVPRPVPILGQLIAGLIHPQAQNLAANRPTSRVDVLEHFLGDFLGSLASGLGAARGPGAFGKGFAASVTEPYDRSLQQFQLSQQSQLNQSELAQRQAQTQLTQAQLAGLPAEQQAKLGAMTQQPRFDPNTGQYLGNMNDAQYQNYIKGQGAANQSRLGKQAQADLQAGKVAKYLPTPDGRYAALDAKGNILHIVDGTVDPQMLQRFTTTQKPIPMGDGSIQMVPITTTSGVAGAATPQAQLQSKVPALGQNQTPQSQLQNKVPALGAAATPKTQGGPRTIYTNAPVFATNPQTGEMTYMTASQAHAQGLNPGPPVKETDIKNEKSASAMIGEVQLNKSRYQAAMDQFYREPVTAKQGLALAALTPERLGIDIGHGFGLSLPDVIQKVTNAEAFADLSKTQKQAMVGYYSTLASIPTYQKALSNIGRSNKEMLDLELRTVPTPLMDKETFGIMSDRFQGNIDQVGDRMIRFPGIPTVKDVRAKFEGSGQTQLPTIPADVQQLLSTKWTNR